MFSFKKISAVVFSLFLCFFSVVNTAFAGGKYAKVIILSEYGSGKTSVMHVLVSGENPPIPPSHTFDLMLRERFFEFDDCGQHYSVSTKLWDSSAEEPHKDLLIDFCQNATVAIIIIDLSKICETPCSSTFFNEITANWIDDLINTSPNCKFILVGTKRDLLDGQHAKLGTAKETVERFASYDQIRQRVGEGEHKRIVYVSAQKDNPQELSETLIRLIADAIKDYGLANLQDRPTKMSAKLVRDVPKKQVTKTGHKTIDVPKFTRKDFGGWFSSNFQDVKDGTERKTVDYQYTVDEDDEDAATYKIEYYGEF